MANDVEIETERLLNNVKREVKQIMEEAVTKKFIYEESNCILALCSAVEACMLHGLKKRALGLFKNNSSVALLQKTSKTFEPAASILKQLQEIEAAAAADASQPPPRRSDGIMARSPSLPRRPPTNPRYLWIRLALFEKQLARIVEHLAENAGKFYEPEALMSDPVRGPILSSLLVGPCALDYTRVKTADSYWTDPPAEELLQRHRIHGNTTAVTRGDSPKRPGLQLNIRRHPSWTSEDNVRSSPPSAKEYVASLHQNNKSTLLYGKNNVTVQPKEDVETLAGYLSLHQLNDASVLLKWMPNQLMNGCYDNNKDEGDRRPVLSRHQSLPNGRHGYDKLLYWDYAVLVNMCDIVYLHCHQPGGAGGGVLVMVGQDGVQRPPIQFPRGGHLLAFLSCLENGLQPAKCLDPPLWSQRGKGKVFPKLKRNTSQQQANGGGGGGQQASVGSGRSSGDEGDSADGDGGDGEESDVAADYVFRIISAQSQHNPGTQSASVTTPGPLPFFWHVWMPSPAASTTPSSVQPASVPSVAPPMIGRQLSQPEHSTITSHRTVVKQLCDTMARQIVSRAFYGWLSYCRQVKTVRTHLSALTVDGGADDADTKYAHGLTETVWASLCPAGVVLDGGEMYRSVYYGGCTHSLRRVVWLYLLGHYDVAMTTDEQQAKDVSSREQYERAMSEWMAVEAIVRQREAETHASAKAASSESQDGASGAHLALQHKDSTLSNEVFESIDDADAAAGTGDYAPRQSTVAEETSSPSTDVPPPASLGVAVATQNGAGNEEEQGQACNGVHTDGDTEAGRTEAQQQQQEGGGGSRGSLRSIIITDASVDQPDQPSPTANTRHMTLELGLTPLAETNEHLSASKESLVLPASPQSNTSHGGVYSTELLDNVALNLHRIDKDVARCDRNYVYFLVPGNLDKLRNIVSTYVWQHLDIGYMQGMCDLVAPLLVVFDDECQAFSCFTLLMKRMIHNFPTGTLMDQHFANMRSLVQILDPELFEHMHHTGDFTHFYFSYRWFLLDFKRELTYDGTFAVWEAIWAAKNVSSSHFVLFVALALVELYREIILDNHMDFTDVLKFFNEMAERHDVGEVLKLSRALVQKLQQLVENK